MIENDAFAAQQHVDLAPSKARALSRDPVHPADDVRIVDTAQLVSKRPPRVAGEPPCGAFA